jgi:thiamine biosynthesis lipoprotein
MFLRLFLFLCTLPSFAGEPFIYRRPCMGTVWTLKIHAGDEKAADAAAEAAFARVSQLNAILSDYLEDSELSRLSATAGSGKPVLVAGDLWTVLTLSREAARESGGVFDITVGPCARLWRTAKKTHRLPSPEALAAARAATGWENLVLDTKAGTALLKKPGMLLDAGGIAKGYAQDEAMKILRDRHGITSALIDAGGGILVSGRPPGREGWNIQVAKSGENDPGSLLQVENLSVATSGDLYQTVEIEGRHYSHIIDKATGLGMTGSVQSTVVAPSGALADWLATTLCLMGPEKGLLWLKEKHPGIQARVVSSSEGEMKTKETDGFKKLTVKTGP